MTWVFKGKEIKSVSDFTVEPYGFVYEITQKSTGKKYIGKKKIRTKGYKESNWTEYYGSSWELIKTVRREGKEDFDRKILYLAPNAKMLTLFENLVQTKLKVLEGNQYFNRNIVFKKYWGLTKLPQKVTTCFIAPFVNTRKKN